MDEWHPDLEPTILRGLAEEGLLPPTVAPAGLVPPEDIDLRDRFRGALLGGAIGDALGRPAETRPRHVIRERYGWLDDFLPWHGYRSGPVGTYTDDTQLTICVAQCLIAGAGRLNPADLGERIVQWLPVGRGKGVATVAAAQRLTAGVPWHEAGEPSAGNGAAMRAAPVGLAHLRNLPAMRIDAALQAIPTHRTPMAVVSSAVMAYATAWCASSPAFGWTALAFLDALPAVAGDMTDPGAVERRSGADRPVRLMDRIGELPGLLDLGPDEAFDILWNGAFVLESLPAAMWCFLASPQDYEQVVVTAVNQGRDADTVAAMAGTLAGALVGALGLPQRWVNELEDRELLESLADQLLGLSGSRGQG